MTILGSIGSTVLLIMANVLVSMPAIEPQLHIAAEVSAIQSFPWATFTEKPFLEDQIADNFADVILCDANLDGEKEIIITTSMTERIVPSSEIFAIEDGTLESKYGCWGLFNQAELFDDELVYGEFPYYRNSEGETVIVHTGTYTNGANNESLLEICIDKEFETRLLFTQEARYDGSSYRYFESDGKKVIANELEMHEREGETEISKEEYDEKVAQYWQSLEPLGTIPYQYITEYHLFDSNLDDHAFEGVDDMDNPLLYVNLNKKVSDAVSAVWWDYKLEK